MLEILMVVLLTWAASFEMDLNIIVDDDLMENGNKKNTISKEKTANHSELQQK